VGTFSFRSNKQEHQGNAHQGRCRAHMFVMRVAEELETWPEYSERRRCWVSSSGGCSGSTTISSSIRRCRMHTTLLQQYQSWSGFMPAALWHSAWKAAVMGRSP
jgi:hypothetical protein